ncbi:MAG: hypothetical protein ACYTHM_13120, partial [Planctomycetota bacterium]
MHKFLFPVVLILLLAPPLRGGEDPEGPKEGLGPREAFDENAFPDGPVLPRPCYENTLIVHWSVDRPPKGSFPLRLYLTTQTRPRKNRMYPELDFKKGTHRWPSSVKAIVEGGDDLRNADWRADGSTVKKKYYGYEYKYSASFSLYNEKFWEQARVDARERTRGRRGNALPPIVWTAAGEVQIYDMGQTMGGYSPWMIKEFRDYLTHRGIYDRKKGKFPGYPGGWKFADDPSPATGTGGKSFNETFGTDFTTWTLKYWDPDKFPDPLPLDAPTMPKRGKRGHTPGGFDPPRKFDAESLFCRVWKWPDERNPGFLEKAVHHCVDGIYDILRNEVGIDRSYMFTHQWCEIGSAFRCWYPKQKKWMQGYKSRVHWTTHSRHGRLGISGADAVQETEMLDDLERMGNEISLAECYPHGGERDLHAREEYLDIYDFYIAHPVHQLNHMWKMRS